MMNNLFRFDLRDTVREGVKIHDDEIYRARINPREICFVLFQTSPRKNTSMNHWMEALHTSVENFRVSRVIADRFDRDPVLS